MRASVSRGLLLPSAVCAALIFGPVGTAAAAVDTHPTTAWPVTWDVTDVSDGGWAFGTDAFAGRFGVPEKDDTFAPLVDTATRIAEGARRGMDASEAAAYADALRTANAEVQRRLADEKGTSEGVTDRAADPVSDAVSTVQSLVDGLLKALASLNLPGVLSTVTGLLSTVVGVVGGVVGGLLGGLPPLPAVP
ncbi:MAG TPA: hypothetical protein VIU15_16330 [Streptomyces sp.]